MAEGGVAPRRGAREGLEGDLCTAEHLRGNVEAVHYPAPWRNPAHGCSRHKPSSHPRTILQTHAGALAYMSLIHRQSPKHKRELCTGAGERWRGKRSPRPDCDTPPSHPDFCDNAGRIAFNVRDDPAVHDLLRPRRGGKRQCSTARRESEWGRPRRVRK